MLPRPPLVSIITVTYNSAHLLEGTIRSVLMQNYPHIEYLIIDGASTDHTETIIKLTQNTNERLLNAKMFRWVSEPDRGLYEAMNKGLRMATGDFVWFLNAGDRLLEKDTVGKMMQQYSPDVDVLFGEVMLVTETRRHLGTRSELTTQKLPETLTWESLKLGMVVCHQAFAVRKSIAPAYIGENLAADIDWVIGCLKNCRKAVNTHLILAEYLTGGLSKQRHKQSLSDRYEVLKEHFGFWPNLWHHVLILWRAIWNNTGGH
jgi:glycosyltransferase involved in cell wall biosynthesis